MKKIALLPLALLLVGHAVFADDQLRNVQTQLKSAGFYYGEVNGQASAESTAAIRRYQIRNGLEVTGTLNQETLAAIGLAPAKAPAPKAPVAATKPAPAPPPSEPVEKKGPPVNLRRDPTAEESDRNFLRREETRAQAPDAVAPLAPNPPAQPDERSIVRPPLPLEAPGIDFPVLFAGTPYAKAPEVVQRQTLLKAQTALASRGYYQDVVDGLPGPATEEALLTYQRAQRMTLTGRLDMETLSQLRLLPTTTYSPAGGYREPRHDFRGIWINKDRGGLRFGLQFN